MTNQQATTKAKKRWGKSFYVRNGESMSSPEKRDSNRDQYKAADAEIKAIGTEIDRRLRELDWYQELRAKQRVLRKEADKAQSIAFYYRFNVGESNGMFNTILGSGDTWEEAFAQADARA